MSAAGDLDMDWDNSVRIGDLLAKKLELRLTESNDGYAGYLR